MKRTKLTTAVLIAATIFAATGTAFAQQTNNVQIKPEAVSNLVKGINSSNQGLKQSAIFLAGKYKVAGTVDALIKELKAQDNTDTKALIAFALYMIGDEAGIEAVSNLDKESVSKVSKIVNDYYEKLVEKNKTLNLTSK